MNNSILISNDTDFCRSAVCYEYYDRIITVTHFYIGGVYAIAGIIGRILLLFLMISQIKRQIGYSYQVILIACDLCTDVFSTLYLISWYWLANKNYFRFCYVCMFYATYLAIAMASTFILNNVLMTLMVSMDRLFAMLKPLSYKSFNHRRAQIIWTIGSVLFSLLINIYDCFPYRISMTSIGYDYVPNESFMNSNLANSILYLRTSLEVIVLILLMIISAVMVYSYKRFRRNAQLIRKEDSQSRQNERQNERILILLAIVQCSTSTIITMTFPIYYFLRFSSFGQCECPMLIAAVLMDGLAFVLELFGLLMYIILNKPFWILLRRLKQTTTPVPRSDTGPLDSKARRKNRLYKRNRSMSNPAS